MQDFMPRMAVIDTTEYGKDTVLNLEDDAYVKRYDGGPGRSSDKRRGSRGGSRGRGSYKDLQARAPQNRPGRYGIFTQSHFLKNTIQRNH